MDLDVLLHYKLGVETLDLQHVDLFSRVNTILDNLEDKKIAVNLLVKYLEATGIHFETEERYMREHKYPYTASHLVDHCYLVRKVKELIEDIERSYTDKVDRYPLLELNRLLISHIDHYDMQLGVFLQKENLK